MAEVKAAEVGTKAGESTLFAGSPKGTGPQPGDGSEQATLVRAHGDIPAPDEGDPEHDSVVNMAKHLDSWAQSYGDDALARAVDLAGSYRVERQDAADAAAKADAAQARAASGQAPAGAPVGRSAAGKSTT